MEELFLTVIDMSLTASYAIVLIMLLRLPLKKAPRFISFALWSVVAFRLLCPFSFESIFSLFPLDVLSVPQEFVAQQAAQMAGGMDANEVYGTGTLSSPVMAVSHDPLQIYKRIATYIWITGAATLLTYCIVSVMRLKRQLQNAQQIEQNIYEAGNLKTPFVLGLLTPKIYIPAGLTAQEKEYILRHEQTHIRRGDPIIKLFAFGILSIHWFNPLAWLAFHEMNIDMELSCDEKVIAEMGDGAKKAYSATLLSLASGQHIVSGSPLAFGEGNVEGRIKNILNYRKPSFWLILCAVIVAVAVSIGLLANPLKKDIKHNDDAQVLPPDESSISYELTRLENGEALRTVLLSSNDDAQLAEDVVMSYIIKSAAWEGRDIASLEDCYLLRAIYSDGTSTDYYAYILDGRAVMQHEPRGYYSYIDDELFAELARLVQNNPAMVTAEGMTKDASTRADLAASISQAILNVNQEQYHSSGFAAEAHSILKTVESDNTVTVYVMALYLVFNDTQDRLGLPETSGHHMPLAITFEKNDKAEYELSEYWTPQEGTQYAPSIQEKFPSNIYEDALDTQKYITAHTQSCYAQAIEHGIIDADTEIDRLLEDITSSPMTSSNPQDYIEEHYAEYRRLIDFGKYTLRYCFTLFEQGGQTGLTGHIMAAACRDILGAAEAIEAPFDTGQDWYDAFKKRAVNLRQAHSDAELESELPGTYFLLQMLNAAQE